MADDNTIRDDEQRLVDGVELLKATEGRIVPDHERGTLTAAHADYLAGHAVDTVLAERLGVRSLTSREDTQELGDVWPNWSNFPAILFPWTAADGRVEYQLRPDDPTEDTRGRLRKYVFRRNMTPVLWEVRPSAGAELMIIIEGTKQCLSAASYAPPGVAVYGIAGCRSWQVDGTPIPDLAIADGREVVVILDADAADNPEVYDAGTALAQALDMEGATKITFGRLTGGGKAGLDDILATRPADRRADYLARIIAGAKPKPADAKPKPKRKKSQAPTDEDGRVTVICNNDRYAVINDLTNALINRWDGRELFNHGGVISRLAGQTMNPVDRGSFHDVVQSTAKTMNENEGANGTTYSFAWPDAGTMSATMSRADKFSTLDRISHAPFVRPDGTIVTEPGYDEATRTILMADPELEGLQVPDEPTADEIAAARTLIMEDWFGDFPFDSDADRANVMALIVTPAIRGMIPRVPMAVVDGLQMAVGKNLLTDCLLTVYTGHPAQPMNWVSEPDELRKQITSAFRTGAEFFVFDEAHTLEGAPLAQALTAETWQDRILGVSTMANFPNRVTWMSLGNQVQVRGDITRRVYRIALRPKYANPQDRQASSFRHPGQSGLDLGSWTRKHRRDLMTAVLTLVRAWFAAGQPLPSRGVSFGSFEGWERIVGGIVETAGMPDFLGNLKVWRSESDFDSQYWIGHLHWLLEQFGSKSFKTGEVKQHALADVVGFAAPPRLDDPSEKAYGKSLGEAYSRLRGRRYEGLWIERDGSAHGHVSTWRVFQTEDPGHPAPPPAPAPEPVDKPVEEPVDIPELDAIERSHETLSGYDQREREEREMLAAGNEPTVATFDLETGDADDLYRTPGDRYVRIGAVAHDDGEVIAYGREHVPAADLVALNIREARTITGHNIMAFDLPALVRAGTLTMTEVHQLAFEGRLFDALLVARYLDPPMARDKGVDQKRKYDLGTLAGTYDLGDDKLSDVSKALGKKYGGWAEIPIDTNDPDPQRAADAADFIGYMKRDVELSRRLHAALLDKLGGTMPEYLIREHRVAAIAAQISVNGFKVDPVLLATRVNQVRDQKADAIQWLAEQCGIPTTNEKGKPYASPLATKAGKAALEEAFRKAGATSFWRTGVSGEFSTSAEHMRHLAAEYAHIPAVRAIAKHVYLIVGARSVYQTADDHTMPDGRVHPRVGFDQATGRWSVTRPGLTVFGKRAGKHVERDIFVPDPGEVLISADLSQVDMRAVAGLSQDQAYIQMLESEDPHAEIAAELFGDRSKREIAKPIGHGWNYGRGIKAISEGEGIDPALVRQFDTSMREKFPRLVSWRDEVRALAESGSLLDNGFGRMMRPDPQRSHTQGPALMGQGAARDLMMQGLLRLPGEILPMLRAQVHDEIVLSVPEKRAEEIGRAVVEALSFEWRGVPILADVSRPGRTWGACYAKD